MKPLCPRHKRLKREGRLQASRHWLPKYEGKNIIKGYSKHFGVNKICASLELRMLGYEISDDYIDKLKADELLKQRLKEKSKKEKEFTQQNYIDQYSDETFYFIAGYTSNGTPYGLTLDELEQMNNDSSQFEEDDELPF